MLGNYANRSVIAPSIWIAGCVAAVVIALPGPAAAQSTQAPPLVADAPVGVAATAEAALEATAAKYRALKTYRDEFHFTARITYADNEAPDLGYLAGTLVFAAPNRLVSRSDDVALYYDGETLRRLSPSRRQYTTETGKAALRALRPGAQTRQEQSEFGVHPLVALLADRNLSPKDALAIAELDAITPDARNGRPRQSLSGKLHLPKLPGGGLVPFTAFISNETGLFEEVRADLTEAARATEIEKVAGAKDIQSAEVVLTFNNVVLDGAVTDEQLAFDPAGLHNVESIGYRAERTIDPASLIGLPAPELSGATLCGPMFDLAAQRGQPTIVAFWGTWILDARRLLTDLRQIAERYASAPVVVVGVNRNAAVAEQSVRALLESVGASYPQVLDRDGVLSERWQIASLPAVFLIDGKGVVADVLPLWTNESRELLSERVAGVLKSEPCDVDDPAIRRAQAEGENWSDGPSLRVPADAKPKAVLKAVEMQSVRGRSWEMFIQDVDADGEFELLMPTGDGGISVVRPSTGAVTRVNFPNTRGATLQSVHGQLVDGQVCWLCVFMKYRRGDADETPRDECFVRLHAPDGEILWTYRPEVPEDHGVSVNVAGGDLDGDGVAEYVLGITQYVHVNMGEDRWGMRKMQSRLLVLNQEGELFAERALPSSLQKFYVPPAMPGKPIPLLCILVDGTIERFNLAPLGSTD